MSSPSFLSVPQRLAPPSEQWRLALRQALCDARVALPGIIKSFDSAKQTVTVQPAIRENINRNLVSTPETLPLLPDVPIVVPRAGGYSITFPIKAGDECLVVFADMCIDAWWQSGDVQNQVDKRRHDLADAFAIVGPWSQPRVLSSYSVNSVQIRNDAGDRLVEITQDQVHVLSSKVVIDGNSEIDINGGNVNIGGTVKINGKEFLAHKHVGVQTGGGNTGGVF